MSSPPLAALHINPPPDPMDSIGKLVMLKNALAQQQLIPGQIQAQKQQLEAGAQENQMRAQQITDQQAMTQAMQEWDGKDINTLPGLVVKHGASAQAVMTLKSGIIKQQQDLANLSKDQLANQATVSDQLLGHIDTLKRITDPVQRAAAAKDQANQILSSPIAKMLDPQTAQMIQGMAQGQIVPNDDQLSIFEKGLTAHSKQIDEAVKASEAQKNTAQGEEAKTNTAKLVAEINFYKKAGLAPGVPIDTQEAADWLAKNPDKGPADFMRMKAGLTAQANASAQAAMLTGAAKDMAAQVYATTGQLPAGMRSPGMSASILNQAANGPNGVPNIAANKATYHADAASLASIQKNFDNVTAFENTAGKNLDTFLKQANKVVDSGSPWINRPLRSLNASMLGSDDQVAFNAARTTALTEIAKVLNSSNASGVLSDSARHEVEGLIGPNATLKQIVSAANILKQDMANRHGAYQDQINAIKGRMGASQPESNQQPPSGKSLSMTQIQQAAKDHGVSVDEAKRQAQAAGYQIIQ